MPPPPLSAASPPSPSILILRNRKVAGAAGKERCNLSKTASHRGREHLARDTIPGEYFDHAVLELGCCSTHAPARGPRYPRRARSMKRGRWRGAAGPLQQSISTAPRERCGHAHDGHNGDPAETPHRLLGEYGLRGLGEKGRTNVDFVFCTFRKLMESVIENKNAKQRSEITLFERVDSH